MSEPMTDPALLDALRAAAAKQTSFSELKE